MSSREAERGSQRRARSINGPTAGNLRNEAGAGPAALLAPASQLHVSRLRLSRGPRAAEEDTWTQGRARGASTDWFRFPMIPKRHHVEENVVLQKH